MANLLGIVLILLAIVVLVVCVLGLIRPQWLAFSKDGAHPSRLFIVVGLLLLPLMLFLTGSSLLDPPNLVTEIGVLVPTEAAPASLAQPAENN